MASMLQINSLDRQSYNLIRAALPNSDYLQLSLRLTNLMMSSRTQGGHFVSNFIQLRGTVTFGSSNFVLFHLRLTKCFRNIKVTASLGDSEVSPYLMRLEP